MLKIVALLVLLGAALCAARPLWHELEGYTFSKYLKDFGKHYPKSTEHYARSQIFEANLAKVRRHNAGNAPWKMGINHMSDWSEAETTALRGYVHDPNPSSKKVHQMSNQPLPYMVDWRMQQPSVLTAVKDQGKCGSCWTFAGTETVETYTAMATGDLYELSTQQMASCTQNPNQCGGNGGCGGGTYTLAWDWIMALGGQAQEWTYSYTSYWGMNSQCLFNASKTIPMAQITGYVQTTKNDPSSLMDALAHVGPLAVAVDASHWTPYESGIFTGCNYANNISIDHAVQLVGYGTDKVLNMDYWIIRNSWSPAWGESGFIRLARNFGEECGWCNHNRQGIGCLTSPHNIWTCGTCGIAVDAAYALAARSD